ncbi:uncharacterized protein IUM83_02731 [Phytophthora cinnamomi]|uniref:uncharacterized protein n=1 Tax=Phytophthora cinnamomi TaxID=4785 RepID=UPI00355AB397|nr:hypothetical protein IUM83_02731 [Phytophthora cinnamomi]
MSAAPRPATFTNWQVANFYFRPCRDQYDEVILEYFRCSCGAVRKRAAGARYTNLMQHIRREHPAHTTEMLAATPGETGSLAHYVCHSAQNMFGWLEWVVKCNLPLSFCENKLARRYTNLMPTLVETLHRSLESVTRSVERAIAAEMPDRFGLVFDGWSHASEHYIAVFAWYKMGDSVYCPLLCMAPLINEDTDDHTAESHRSFWPSGQADERPVSRVCEPPAQSRGVSTNARALGGPGVGANAYGRQTHLRPIIRQQTRWSSTFAMLHRFFEMLPFLDSDDEELVDVLPSAAAKRRLRALLEELKNVESVSKALQGEGVNMLDVRVWFDGLIASKPSYSRYLGLPLLTALTSSQVVSEC